MKNVVNLRLHLLYLFSVMLIRTLRRAVLEPIAKRRNAAVSVLFKVLGSLRKIFMKLVRVSRASHCIYATQMLI
jgi:hypothetical protein